jgi:hypothetical protein
MSEDHPIDVEPMLPATLRFGDKTLHCLSVEEAMLAFQQLPANVRDDASLRLAGGTMYSGAEIGRLRCRARSVVQARALET